MLSTLILKPVVKKRVVVRVMRTRRCVEVDILALSMGTMRLPPMAWVLPKTRRATTHNQLELFPGKDARNMIEVLTKVVPAWFQ
jgi:hypothetical protein